MHLSAVIHQKSYEHIEYVLRRDPITFVPKLVLFFFLFLLPAGAYAMLKNLFPDLVSNEIAHVVLLLGGSVYYLSTILFLYTQFIIFYLDVWVVTNDRIVDMEQVGLFSRTISELDLFRIQDVTSEVNGIFPSIFHYGNLYVKTASVNTNIVFHNIPRPEFIRQELLRLADVDRKYHGAEL